VRRLNSQVIILRNNPVILRNHRDIPLNSRGTLLPAIRLSRVIRHSQATLHSSPAIRPNRAILLPAILLPAILRNLAILRNRRAATHPGLNLLSRVAVKEC